MQNSFTAKIQDGGRRYTEFRIMSVSQDRIKIFAPNVVGRCMTAVWIWPHDKKTEPEVNSRDVIKRTSGTKVCWSQILQKILQPNLVQSSSTTLASWWNVQNSLIVKIQDGGGCHIEFQKNTLILDWYFYYYYYYYYYFYYWYCVAI